MKKQEFCKKYNITERQFTGEEKIESHLDLSSLTSIPEGFNPTVGGYLYLSSLTSIPEGFNPTVGGYLNLSSLTSIPEGFNPTVGGSLDLSSLTSIPEGFNPTVGGYLNLSSLTSIPEGFNPTVGGSLDLSSLTSIPEGFNPTVGGSLDLSSGLKCNTKPLKSDVIVWKNHILVDGVFTQIVRRVKNTFVVRKLNTTTEFYLVTDLKFTHAHGNTLESAKADYKFKILSVRFEKEPLTLDSEVTVARYRAITGSCDTGVRMFLDSVGIPYIIENNKTIEKSPMKVRDLLPILKKNNAYGLSKFEQLIQN